MTFNASKLAYFQVNSLPSEKTGILHNYNRLKIKYLQNKDVF